MQVTDIFGTKEPVVQKKSGAHRAEYKLGQVEMAKEVQEKLRQAEEGATVAISAEGLGLVKRDEEADEARREAAEKQMYQEMLENTKEAAEAQGEGYADLAKALEIARRILNGDIVPAQDEQFLMEFNSEIYMRVKSMAEAKEDPEEYDSLLEEEEEDAPAEAASQSESLPASGSQKEKSPSVDETAC